MVSFRRLLWASLIVLTSCGSGGSSVPTQISPDPTYPPGPYGFNADSRIADFMVTGLKSQGLTANLLDQPFQDIWLSGYRSNYDAVVVVISIGDCSSCVDELNQLKDWYVSYNQNKPTVAVLEVLVWQDESRTPADSAMVTRWVTQYGMTYDVAYDSAGVLGPLYPNSGFPWTYVVRTSDMHIIFDEAGDSSGLQAAIDSIVP
jgi:hypothetical protein